MSILGRRLNYQTKITYEEFLPNVDKDNAEFMVFDDCQKEYEVPLSGAFAGNNIRFMDQGLLTNNGGFGYRHNGLQGSATTCTNLLPTYWLQNSTPEKYRFWERDVQYWSGSALVVEITNMKAKDFLAEERKIPSKINPNIKRDSDAYRKAYNKELIKLYERDQKEFFGQACLNRVIRAKYQKVQEADDIEEHIIIRNMPEESAVLRYNEHPLWERYLPEMMRFMTKKEYEKFKETGEKPTDGNQNNNSSW
jgi:hypothetical protein